MINRFHTSDTRRKYIFKFYASIHFNNEPTPNLTLVTHWPISYKTYVNISLFITHLFEKPFPHIWHKKKICAQISCEYSFQQSTSTQFNIYYTAYQLPIWLMSIWAYLAYKSFKNPFHTYDTRRKYVFKSHVSIHFSNEPQPNLTHVTHSPIAHMTYVNMAY